MTPKVLYIGGSGRSGSTVLEQLLATRAGYVAVGELRYLWQRGLVDDQLCSCGAAIRSCPFWTDVLVRAFGAVPTVAEAEAIVGAARQVDRVRHVPGLATRRLRSPGLGRELAVHHDRLRRLYAAIADTSGAAVIVDSSKDPSYAFVLAAQDGAVDIDLAVLHLVRDSRAVAHSWTRLRRRPEVHWTTQYMRQVKPARAGREWLISNALFEVLARRHEPTLRVRYEDFVIDAEQTIDRIASLTGAPAAEPASTPLHHSVSGNPSRFAGQAPVLRLDDEWREKLATRDRVTVTAITAPLLFVYGYIARAPRGPTASRLGA